MLVFSFYTHANAGDLIINKEIQYPYKATEARAETIKSRYKSITKGMPASKVIEILGEPDQTHTLYEPKIKTASQIGFTHWYLMQRLQKNGSADEKQEKLVRIAYDLNWKTIAIDHWGFE